MMSQCMTFVYGLYEKAAPWVMSAVVYCGKRAEMIVISVHTCV